MVNPPSQPSSNFFTNMSNAYEAVKEKRKNGTTSEAIKTKLMGELEGAKNAKSVAKTQKIATEFKNDIPKIEVTRSKIANIRMQIITNSVLSAVDTIKGLFQKKDKPN
jgi:hypothetical protein